MSDLDKILVTSGLTIFGALLIHVFSQMFIKIFLEPCVEYKKSRADVITYLIFYSNILDARLHDGHNDDYKKRHYKAQEDIRLSMAKYRASYYSISPQFLAIIFRIIPKFQKFEEISRNLLSLSFLGDLKIDGDPMFENSKLAKATLKLLGVQKF